jgi:uncharacterized RDD family membrane protein YckC
MKASNINSRLLTFIIDLVVSSIVTISIILLLKKFNQSFEQYNKAKIRLIIFTVYFGYYLISESLFSSTLGKLIAGNKVVDGLTFTKPSFIKIFVRTLARFIPFEFLSIFFTDDHILWHDIISRTTVIKDS